MKKINKSDSNNPFVVRFEPIEPGVRLTCPSATHARHWVATYALFRVGNQYDFSFFQEKILLSAEVEDINV